MPDLQDTITNDSTSSDLLTLDTINIIKGAVEALDGIEYKGFNIDDFVVVIKNLMEERDLNYQTLIKELTIILEVYLTRGPNISKLMAKNTKKCEKLKEAVLIMKEWKVSSKPEGDRFKITLPRLALLFPTISILSSNNLMFNNSQFHVTENDIGIPNSKLLYPNHVPVLSSPVKRSRGDLAKALMINILYQTHLSHQIQRPPKPAALFGFINDAILYSHLYGNSNHVSLVIKEIHSKNFIEYASKISCDSVLKAMEKVALSDHVLDVTFEPETIYEVAMKLFMTKSLKGDEKKKLYVLFNTSPTLEELYDFEKKLN